MPINKNPYRYHNGKCLDFPFSPEVKKIFSIFAGNIRIVGGAIRDYLLGRNFIDIDFVTNLTVKEITSLLDNNQIKYKDYSQKYNNIIAIINNKSFDITATRIDEENFGRKANVKYINDYKTDSFRRDFTINALYIDNNKNIYDYNSSLKDLQNKEIRFIGDAEKRIKEDYLRIFRYFRFYLYFGSKINLNYLEIIKKNKNNISILSNERIRSELISMLKNNNNYKLYEIFKIFKDISLLDSKKIHLDLSLFNISLSNYIYINYELNYISKIFLIFTRDSLPYLKLSKKEYKYLKFLYNKIYNIKNIYDIIYLLFDNDYQIIFDLLIIYNIIKSKEDKIENIKINLNKEILLLNNFHKKIIDYNFDINGHDILNLGYNKFAIKKVIRYAKYYLIKCDFTISKSELITIIAKNENIIMEY